MERLCLMVLLVLIHLLVLSSAGNEPENHDDCPPVECGKIRDIKFPFTTQDRPQCGLFTIQDCHEETQSVQLETGGSWYPIYNIYYDDDAVILISDEDILDPFFPKSCETFNNFTFPSPPSPSIQFVTYITLVKCDPTVSVSFSPVHFPGGCSNFNVFFAPPPPIQQNLPSGCSLIQLPMDPNPNTHLHNNNDMYDSLSANFTLEVIVSPDCKKCFHRSGGKCLVNGKGKFYCSKGRKNLRLELGLGIGVPLTIMLVLLLFYVFRRHYKGKRASPKLLPTSSSSEPSFKEDLEGGTVYFGVPVFSYSELEVATSNFSSENELGDGGFGIVYYGKLRDGREVAVKRLYSHNLKRFEQFMNEIEILTRLRHRNLVSLYGCTSRRSKELLLVYEYIPNGTVADHLHGDRAKSCPLTWDVRMSIAIETASALAYLHASDIIHRDVKTNNILLDNNFCVKVADFGLSKLFPTDASHVSTAPQGTPGYVDPEYHQCYQLTGKSDVYSFGVVLIELISSMPAVDITRQRSEINLANLAINKIQKCALEELVDPCLGYNTDEEIKRMTTLVAELAFRCLQQEKDMRPTMVDVLQELIRIQSGDPEKNLEEVNDNMEPKNTLPPPSPQECDEDSLLKNIRPPPSPISVTDRWISSSTTKSDVSG